MAGKKLLVADDSLTIQKVIRLALSNEGYEIQAVSDGNDAVQQISLFRPDVVLIDVSLPGKSAFEVKREINEHDDLAEVRFVLMSSAFEKVDEGQMERVGFHGQLTKPFDPAHLRQVLVDVLAQVAAQRMERTSLLESPSQSMPSLRSASTVDGPPPPSDDTLARLQEPAVGSEEWDQPISPELPTMPSPPTEALQDLWEKEQSSPAIMMAPPPFSGSVPPPLEGLGFDPPPPPPFSAGSAASAQDTEIKELTESTIRISGLDDFQWNVNEPSLKPPTALLDQGGSSFPMESSAKPDKPEPPEATTGFEFDPPVSEKKKTADEAVSSGISSEKIEEIVREQVEEALEKFARKLLPEVAEKIIKQEIHRLLSD